MATTNKVKGWTGVLMTEDSSPLGSAATTSYCPAS